MSSERRDGALDFLFARHRGFRDDLSFEIVSAGPRAKANGGLIDLRLVVEETNEARGPPDEQNQETRRERIERSRVSHAPGPDDPARTIGDRVRRNAGRLIGQPETVSPPVLPPPA